MSHQSVAISAGDGRQNYSKLKFTHWSVGLQNLRSYLFQLTVRSQKMAPTLHRKALGSRSITPLGEFRLQQTAETAKRI